MKFKKYVLALSVLLLLSSGNVVASLIELKWLFHQTFWSSLYVPNFCGDNIMKFVELAEQKGIPLEGAQVIIIEDELQRDYGQVKAFMARDKGVPIVPTPERSPYHYPGTVNWYYHVILEYQGHIFDYDYTNQPRVETNELYFPKMFIPHFRVNDKRAIARAVAHYHLTVTQALEAIKIGRPETNHSIKQLLKERYPNLKLESRY